MFLQGCGSKQRESPLKYIGVYSVTNKENQATVLGQFTNQGMDAFDFEELALLAQDPDIGEILMCYGNAFGQGEAIQAGTAQLREFIFGAQLTFYGQANVTAQVDIHDNIAAMRRMGVAQVNSFFISRKFLF